MKFLLPLFFLLPLLLHAQEEELRQAAEVAAARGTLSEAEGEEAVPIGSLSINRAGAEELLALGILTEAEVSALLRYRSELGPFGSIWELQAVPGLDAAALRRLLPWIRLDEDPAALLAAGGREGRHSLIGRWTADGDPDALLYYRYRDGKGMAGGGAIRRSGPEILYSVHGIARQKGPLRTVALGDYRLRLGQGLIHGQGLPLGKGAGVSGVIQSGPRLQPQRTAAPSGFNRGLAVEGQKGRWSVLLFGSALRNGDEKEKKTGGALHYNIGGLAIGVQGIYWWREPPRERARGYGALLPAGPKGWKSSLDWRFGGKRAHFFGEAAVDDRGIPAALGGLLAAPHPVIDIGLLYRNLGAGFEGGSALTQAAVPGNERGLYTSWTLRPAPGWEATGSADIFLFPFHRYRVAGVSRGREAALALLFKPVRGTELRMGYRGTGEGRRNIRLEGRREDLAGSWEGRAEAVWTERGGSGQTGWMVFAGAGRKFGRVFLLRGRLMWGATEGWESRIYAFEPDVRYGFSLPAFAGSGGRALLLAGWNGGRHWRVEARWAQPIGYQSYKRESGEGKETGAGRAIVKVQAEYRW